MPFFAETLDLLSFTQKITLVKITFTRKITLMVPKSLKITITDRGEWEKVWLTLRSRHLFSLMAPRQPRKPVTMTIAPMAMTMLAADSEGNEGEKVAKLPCDTESQMPTPSSPQPHNCKVKDMTDDKVRKRISSYLFRVSYRNYSQSYVFFSSPFVADRPLYLNNQI